MTGATAAEKPPTMREQVDYVAGQVSELVKRQQQREQQAATRSGPPPLTEAGALERCMAALTELNETEKRRSQNTSYNYATPAGDWYSNTAIERILRHLAMRYDVRLIETQTEPCGRAHLDTLSPDALFSALSVATGGAR